jgi:hypothetical protein
LNEGERAKGDGDGDGDDGDGGGSTTLFGIEERNARERAGAQRAMCVRGAVCVRM